MLRNIVILLILLLSVGTTNAFAQNSINVRIQDITELKSHKTTILSGPGLVLGLSGTGDEKSERTTRLAFDYHQNQSERKGAKMKDFASKNQASVNASIAIKGSRSAASGLVGEVTISDDSTSLKGGRLVKTVLRIEGDGSTIYGYAYGPINTTGDEPTSGTVSVQLIKDLNKQAENVETDATGRKRKVIRFILDDPNATTQTAIIKAVNVLGAKLGVTKKAAEGKIEDAPEIAFQDGTSTSFDAVKVYVPTSYEKNVAEFVSLIHQQTVNADSVARIVINKRTGVMLWNGNVKIAQGQISVGGVSLTIPASGIIADKPQAGDEVKDPVVPVGGAPEQLTMNDFLAALNSLGLTIEQKHAVVQEMVEGNLLVGKLLVKE